MKHIWIIPLLLAVGGAFVYIVSVFFLTVIAHMIWTWKAVRIAAKARRQRRRYGRVYGEMLPFDPYMLRHSDDRPSKPWQRKRD